jgi:hypothetical protein
VAIHMHFYTVCLPTARTKSITDYFPALHTFEKEPEE